MESIITLTTDFGLKDAYSGAMKGAILSVNPQARITEITHLVPPGNILEGAFILRDACPFFPPGTIHVCVVDPGVGGSRRPILVEAGGYLFIGPDNGVFSVVTGGKALRVIELTNRKYFRTEVSNTFHGRDIFGPVAARLSLGAPQEEFGPEVQGMAGLDLPLPEKKEGRVTGQAIYIDSFGNIITNIEKADLAGKAIEVEIKGRTIKGLSNTYSSVASGSLLALISSSGHLEIAVNSGSAAAALGVAAGERVKVSSE